MAFPVSPLREPTALTPVVIAGGALSGASAACRLARAGRAVVLLERERAPVHKVCGEFLSGEALADLADIGIDVHALGASPISALRLVHRGRAAETRLPFAAAGLSRRILDEALLQRAVMCGAQVQRGVRVRSIEPGLVRTDGGEISADTVLLATGKSELRGLPRIVTGRPETLIGFKLHLRLTLAQRKALTGYVEIVLVRRGYVGLQLVEDGAANLCLLVDRSRYEADGQDWIALLASLKREDPHLADRLEGAEPCWDRPLSVSRVPYGFVHRGADLAGIYRLGDQAAVIPSFCGDGMAIALHSSLLAAAAVLAGHDSATYHRAMRRDAGPPVRLASALYRLTRSPTIRALTVATLRLWPAPLRAVAQQTRVARRSV